MIRVTLESTRTEAVLERVARSLADPRPVMQDIGEVLVASTKKRFTEGKSPDGLPWAAKSEATLSAYAARGLRADPRPLFGPSGVLSSTIFAEVGPDGSSVEVGSNRIYAAVMQFGAAKGAFGTTAGGSSIPWGNIPARPFLGLSEADETEIVATVEDWLQMVAEQGG
jgi:phage virion morphogenesis protein